VHNNSDSDKAEIYVAGDRKTVACVGGFTKAHKQATAGSWLRGFENALLHSPIVSSAGESATTGGARLHPGHDSEDDEQAHRREQTAAGGHFCGARNGAVAYALH